MGKQHTIRFSPEVEGIEELKSKIESINALLSQLSIELDELEELKITVSLHQSQQ